MRVRLAVIFSFGFFLAACGGGGGGGAGGSVSGSRSGVRIIHGVLDASPISLSSSTKPTAVLQSAFFAEESPRVSVEEGEQTLVIFKKGSPELTYANVSLTAERGLQKSLILSGELETLGLQATLVDDGGVTPGASEAAIRVIHAAMGANAVDVAVGDQSPTSAIFGGATNYVTVGVGTVLVSVRRAIDQRLIYQATLDLQGRGVYSLAVLGDLNYLVVGRLLSD